MSLITHRCVNCGHPDYWRHDQAGDQRDRCRECGHVCTPGEPELAPTFDLAGKPVEAVTKPGSKTGFGVVTCGCGACKALHAELTGAAA